VNRSRQAIDELAAIPYRFSGHRRVRFACRPTRPQHGLLTKDGLVVVVMRNNGLSHLASWMRFRPGVPGLDAYAPV